jgi:L-asparaginase II
VLELTDTRPSGVVALVAATRGGFVESLHLGAIAVADVNGTVTWAAGDPGLVSFPRSSLKPFQLLALVARGGVERFGFTSDELAVMAGSHGGEPMHLRRVQQILDKIDAPPEALACGAHAPLDRTAAHHLRRAGSAPSPLHNNCSGKHAGMLALARLLGVSLDNYVDPDHPVQVAIRDCLIGVLELDRTELPIGIDGCGAPAYGMPLHRMARGFGLLGDPVHAPEAWQKPIGTIAAAMRAHPELVGANHARLDTELMRLGHDLIAKSGAEGYFCVGNAAGHGMAVKILDGDGASRARHLAVVAAARRQGWVDEPIWEAPWRNSDWSCRCITSPAATSATFARPARCCNRPRRRLTFVRIA